jgi:hypothetical protein
VLTTAPGTGTKVAALTNCGGSWFKGELNAENDIPAITPNKSIVISRFEDILFLNNYVNIPFKANLKESICELIEVFMVSVKAKSSFFMNKPQKNCVLLLKCF